LIPWRARKLTTFVRENEAVATESVIAATSGISSALAAKAATNGRGSPAVCTENQILQYG
jgi:hypothetical protein